MRRIGVLLPAAANDPQFQTFLAAFHQGLGLLGWTVGRNVRIDTRWAAGHAEIRQHVQELVSLAPDVILAHGTSTVGPLLQATRTIPIVFPLVVDPIGAGFVESLARPGGNATGFMYSEYGQSGKWLELLKEIAPNVSEWGSFAIPPICPAPPCSASSRLLRPRTGSRSMRSTCAMPVKSNAP